MATVKRKTPKPTTRRHDEASTSRASTSKGPVTRSRAKITAAQSFMSTFTRAENTRRNVSKYMSVSMPSANVTNMDPSIVMNNDSYKNAFPESVIVAQYSGLRMYGVHGFRDRILQRCFAGTPLRHVASGAYGDVYTCTVDKTFQNSLKSAYDTGFSKYYNKTPRKGSKVAIKIIPIVPLDLAKQWQYTLPQNLDSVMGRFLTDSMDYIKRNCQETAVGVLCHGYKDKNGHDGSKFFPRIYTSFHDGTSGVFITVMEYIDGKTLHRAGENKKFLGTTLPFKILQQLTKAIETVWLAGFVHSDLHHNNILVTPKEDVKIIDLGMARLIPKKTHEKVKAMLAKGVHADEVWQKSGLGGWSNRNMARRRFSWYNPNIAAARSLVTRKIVDSRRRRFG